MKTLIALTLFSSLSAAANFPLHHGTSAVVDERSTPRLTIEIKGRAAELLFERLNGDGQYIHASERRGRAMVWKDGANYNCRLLIANPGGNNETICEIPLTVKGRGRIGEAGVAHPARNTAVTRSAGRATVQDIRGNLPGQDLVIGIDGLSAERVYNAMSSVRAERSGGPRQQASGDFVDSKNGENISCTKRTRRSTPVRYECGMTVGDEDRGIIIEPGVG